MERTFVPSPHCNTLNDARIWSAKKGTAFKNWFGLYCPECGGIIPCHRNLTSLLIILFTFPIWFIKTWERKWLDNQPARYKGIQLDGLKFKDINWIHLGVGWGVFMFVLMVIIYPLLMGKTISLLNIAIGILIWSLGGLAFGYTLKKWMGRRSKSATMPG